MKVLLLTVFLFFASAAPAYAHETPPPKGNNDSTGCCFSFRDSPVILCMTKDACSFTPPAGGK